MPFGQESGQQHPVAQQVDPPGDAGGPLVDLVEGVVVEVRVVLPADLVQAVFDVPAGLFPVHRPQVVGRNHALAKLFQAAREQHVAQFGLTNQEALQQSLVAELEVREHAQLFDGVAAEVLGLVDDQHGTLVLRGQQREVGLQRGDQLGLGLPFDRHPEGGEGRSQQVAHFELGAHQLGGHHLLVVDVAEQRAHQRGLARADVARHDDEALGLVEAELQVGQGAVVPPAVEVEARVRIEQEWGAVQAEVRLVHACCLRSGVPDGRWRCARP